MPAAMAGSIALALTAAPTAAHADTPAARTKQAPPLQLRAQPAAAPAAPAKLSAVATATPSTYTVVRGDTISAIAARFGLRTADVLAANGLSARTVIYPGQKIRLTGGSATAAPATQATSGSYTVKAGDTVSAIAKRHGTSTNAVLKANRLSWSSIIYPGQKLTIPGAATTAAATPASNTAAATTGSSGSYTVRAGDTVSAIAKKLGVSASAVLSANDLGWSSIIYPGQKLAIPGGATGLNAPQTENARLIIQVGRDLGVPDRGIAIALGTAMQESWLRNLDWGDRDSLGLFQQRPSTGWGTPDQIRDRVRSIKAFFGGSSDPNGSATRGLLDIPGWQSMSFAAAAQAVQISAYPDRYAQWEKPAYAWLAALG